MFLFVKRVAGMYDQQHDEHGEYQRDERGTRTKAQYEQYGTTKFRANGQKIGKLLSDPDRVGKRMVAAHESGELGVTVCEHETGNTYP